MFTNVVRTSRFMKQNSPNFVPVLVRVALQSFCDAPTLCEETRCFTYMFIASSECSICTPHNVRGRCFCEFSHRGISPRRMSSWMFIQPIYDQQNSVACREVTSISSCVDVNSQSVVPSIVSQRMDLSLWNFNPTTTVRSHPEILRINCGSCAVNCSIHQF